MRACNHSALPRSQTIASVSSRLKLVTHLPALLGLATTHGQHHGRRLAVCYAWPSGRWVSAVTGAYKVVVVPMPCPQQSESLTRSLTQWCLQLPENADLNGITARFENGVLTVRTRALLPPPASLQLSCLSRGSAPAWELATTRADPACSA